MSDNNLHLLFKRQIPEYVKTTYPLFVEFLKAYQEFLQQTQSQELEKFRDIDTVTEEFVERFKAELAYNIPLDNVQDKRMLLKNLREFYLSRGSEASYKFIFKTFFGKDVEIAYPSKQMLRVSDGKWKQDVSIFVRNTSSNASTLFPMSGNYITIKSGNKTLVSYVENVVQYSDDIFEVFIQRDLVKSIGVGSTVTFVQGEDEYTGEILLAPKSIKVLKPGKGFRVGDVFNLKTNLGDGCKIKVTQVDGNGGIVRAKILKFALDYTTNFWSYLYSDQTRQLPPLDYFKTGNNNFLNTGDFATENFIEYGYASKQTYMFYDDTIPVGDSSSGASRFFADTNYVGDVYTQIYADNPIDVNLADFAQILVEVGACSIYSGYYLSQDGFISDEIYIQDSNYYQAFSYVIKVEEELRKYADLVKTILHPAGMKMFAEFQILNRINISATTIIRDRVIQISDLLDTLIDRGIGYTAYDITYNEFGDFIHTPKAGAGIVFTPSGQLAYILGKKTNSTVFSDTTDIEKLVTKEIGPSYYILDGSTVSKDVIKELTETIDHTLTVQKNLTKIALSTIDTLISVDKNFTKNVPQDSLTVSSTAVKDFVKNVQNTVNNSVLMQKIFIKPATSEINAELTSFTNTVTKALSSSQVVGSVSSVNFIKVLTSTLSTLQSAISLGLNKTITSQIDLISAVTDKQFVKSITSPVITQDPLSLNYVKGTFASGTTTQSQPNIIPLKNIDDVLGLSETIEDRLTKNIQFLQTITSSPSLSNIRSVDDQFLLQSIANIERYRLVEDEAIILENIIDAIVKSISTTQNFTSTTEKQITKSTIADSVQILDDIVSYLITYIRDLSSTIVVEDSSTKSVQKSIANTLPVLDSSSENLSKPISSSVISSDSPTTNPSKTADNEFIGLTESINNTPSKNLASPITTSSELTSKSKTKQITLEAITDDSGSLKLNTYDIADYFYPNAVDYQNDIVSIT